MISLAVMTANLDADSFQTRQKAELALIECGIFSGGHIESVLKDNYSLEAKMRAKRVWYEMPDFYVAYMISSTDFIHKDYFHQAALDKCEEGYINPLYMAKTWHKYKKSYYRLLK